MRTYFLLIRTNCAKGLMVSSILSAYLTRATVCSSRQYPGQRAVPMVEGRLMMGEHRLKYSRPLLVDLQDPRYALGAECSDGIAAGGACKNGPGPTGMCQNGSKPSTGSCNNGWIAAGGSCNWGQVAKTSCSWGEGPGGQCNAGGRFVP